MRRLAVTIVLFLLIPAGVANSAPIPEIIRVALLKGAESVRIDGVGILVADSDGEALRLSPPLEVRRARDGILVNGMQVRGVSASAPAFMTVNGKRYRGIIECQEDAKGITVIDELPLEEYLVGLINSEISSQWPMEAIKAQAVVARSYAMYQKNARKNAPYQLESSVLDQVYDGSDNEDSRAARGVRETADEVLTYGGKVIQAFYHSSCGGHTEASQNVWGVAVPYLQGVECKYCQSSPSLRWKQILPLERIEARLRSGGYAVAGLKAVMAGERDQSGRLKNVVLVSERGEQMMPAAKFRMAVGSTVIRSTNFEVVDDKGNAVFSGTGYGHGVGLCQWGARQRALDGFNYREILSYYYPGTKLEKISGD